MKNELTKFGFPLESVLYPVDSRVMAFLSVHDRELYEKVDHSDPLDHRNYLFRNGNPLDETQVLPKNASAEQVRQWWANLYGENSEAMLQFDKMTPPLTGEILYSKPRDFFLPTRTIYLLLTRNFTRRSSIALRYVF